MSVQETDILAKLIANYHAIIKSLPSPLADEFKAKIIRTSELKAYAETILVSLEFDDQTSAIRIENWLVDRFKIGKFGRKLADQGINPSTVFEKLLKGFFDYK
jgi:hypothetical protein